MDGSKKKSMMPMMSGIAVTTIVVFGGAYLLQQKKQRDAEAIAAAAKAAVLTQIEQHLDAVAASTASTDPVLPKPDTAPAAPSAPPTATVVVSCAATKTLYLDKYSDVKASKQDAWAHFKANGEKEGRIWPGARCDDPSQFTLETPAAPAPEKTTVKTLIKDNAAAVSGMVTKEIMGTILKKEIKKLIYGDLKSKLMSRTTMKAKKLMISKLEKLGAKLGEKGLSRLGLMATKKAGTIGAKIAAQEAMAAATGPAFPFVDAAFFALDILTVGLDLGDAGGYGSMGTKKSYLTMKKGLDAEMKKMYAENDIPFPAIVGPLDKITADDLNTAVSAEVENVLTVDGSPYMKAVMDKLAAANLNDPDAIAAFMDANKDLIDLDGAHDAAHDNVCVAKGGKILGSDHSCSWATRQSCESSYSWPLSEDNKDIYAEYKADAGGGQGACVSASYGVRGICHTNHLPYDTERGICVIDKKYCLTKSATWEMNKSIGEEDCMIPAGQQFLQNIFGVTIVNGLNQIFNFDQYSKCVPPATDDGYSCRTVTCPPGLEAAGILGNDLAKASTGLIAAGVAGTAAAGTGAALVGLGALAKTDLCYPPCRSGYSGDSFVCWQNKPAPVENHEWITDGAFFRLAGYCPPGKDHNGMMCYDKCRDGYEGVTSICEQICPPGFSDDGLFCKKPAAYGRGVGSIPLKRPCASGLRDDGVSCWKDTVTRGAGRLPDKSPCGPNLRDDGTSCWADDKGRGAGYAIWDGDKCRKHYNVSCKKCLAMYYPPCPAGYSEVGCNLCSPNNGGPGIKTTLFQRQTCKADEDMNGALCYPKCSAGYKSVGCCLCEPVDGAGIKTTLMQRQYCAANQEMIAGLCYDKCRVGYHNVGTNICSPDCPDGQVDIGISCAKKTYMRDFGTSDVTIKVRDSYTRGSGTPPTGMKISLKKRIAPFSNSKN